MDASAGDVSKLTDELEACLCDLFQSQQPAPVTRSRGRPPVLAASVLWLGFLLCVLRSFTSQRSVWRLVACSGFWGRPPIPLTEAAVYQRLARAPVDALQALFTRITSVLRERFAAFKDTPAAAFATDIIALDHSTLDPVLRRLKVLRDAPPGALIPGKLATLFDIRRQLFVHVELEEDAHRNVKVNVSRFLDLLAPGTLLLFDLGYFAFEWFDLLASRGFYYISRLREKTTWVEQHLLIDTVQDQTRLRETLVYLGKYRADRASSAVRLIEITKGSRTWRYITNVLDPRELPAADLVGLYARRWDIEQSFNLLKTHLKLYLLWSARPNVVMLQVYATLIIAQVLLALRTDLAERTKSELREISLPLLIEVVPQIAKNGLDPVERLAQCGRQVGIIRPFRGREHDVPKPKAEEYKLPEVRPPPRIPRYAQKDCEGGRPSRQWDRPERNRSAGWGIRSRRSGPR